MSNSRAFARFVPTAWPFEYQGSMHVERIAGGVPSDPNVAEAWIKKNLGVTTESLLQQQVAEIMVERGVSEEVAAKEAAMNRHVTGFRKDENGLYIMGYQLKAAIKEAVNVAVASGKLRQQKWGKTNKWITGFVAEHVCVMEDKLYLGVHEATAIDQRFVQTKRHGSGINYTEYCADVDINFTITTDWQFTDEEWAMIWLTGEKQGIGATRSQGYGEYLVTRWEQVRG